VTSGAAEVLGLDVGVGVGDGLAVGVGVGVGLGLDDVGVGDGELAGGVLAGVHGAGEGTSTLLLGSLPGMADIVFPWVADGPPEGAWLPLPLVFPGPPDWVEPLGPSGPLFPTPTNVARIPPSAKTPATTRTTAPATASAGRSQAIAGPTE